MTPPYAKIHRIDKNLYLIGLTPLINGFDNFLSVWLYRGDKTFLIDAGPSVTAATLIEALQKLAVHHLDYIFLTHIHLDHAGGVGDLSCQYPETSIVCHPAGMDHLVVPDVLVAGTIKTLGETGSAYGPVQSVKKERLMDADRFEPGWIKPIHTPGHSKHHISYQTEDYLFAGEACGVCVSPSLDEGNYMRPATPPKFYLDVTLQSIEDLISVHPHKICFSHFGVKNDAPLLLASHKKQLLLWKEIISKELLKNGEEADFPENCLAALLKTDPLLANFSRLDKAVQEREKFFMKNSIKGFTGYLQAVGNNP